MKKLSVKKEILIVMMIVIMLLAISSKVLATGTENSPIQIPTINTTTSAVDTNTTTNTTTNVIANAIAPTTNTTASTYQNTTLPQTGDASDYAIFLLIAVAVVIAVYAYKKVRDYNIK